MTHSRVYEFREGSGVGSKLELGLGLGLVTLVHLLLARKYTWLAEVCAVPSAL